MTGYGRGQAAGRGIRVEVELNAVNRKQLEVRVNLPRTLMAVESRVVEQVQKCLSRGQVSGGVSVSVSAGLRKRSLCVDGDLAAAYVDELRKMAKTLGLPDDLKAGVLLNFPEVVSYRGADQDVDYVWPVLKKALTQALAQLMAMRAREGVALADDLRKRLGKLNDLLEQIRKEAPGVTKRYRLALDKRLREAGVNVPTNDPQLMKELALFADRSDITEEITRLESHLKQGVTMMTSVEPVGRTLDFLAQEMFREINTIGSKANEVRITRIVIRFKTELERVREQVQNVE
jgi:uncharacterized protein (TIGR00255 family)